LGVVLIVEEDAATNFEGVAVDSLGELGLGYSAVLLFEFFFDVHSWNSLNKLMVWFLTPNPNKSNMMLPISTNNKVPIRNTIPFHLSHNQIIPHIKRVLIMEITSHSSFSTTDIPNNIIHLIHFEHLKLSIHVLVYIGRVSCVLLLD